MKNEKGFQIISKAKCKYLIYIIIYLFIHPFAKQKIIISSHVVIIKYIVNLIESNHCKWFPENWINYFKDISNVNEICMIKQAFIPFPLFLLHLPITSSMY